MSHVGERGVTLHTHLLETCSALGALNFSCCWLLANVACSSPECRTQSAINGAVLAVRSIDDALAEDPFVSTLILTKDQLKLKSVDFYTVRENLKSQGKRGLPIKKR